MSTFTTSMFDEIKNALNKESKSRGSTDILRTTVGNTYEVRLLPNTADPTKTFHHYYVYGWESFATGQYTSAVSPMTIGERDPIGEARYKDSRFGSVAEKERSKAIYRSEKWLVNVYVVNDPTEPDNNGKVKVLRFGKQLHKIIMAAIEGEDAAEFGPKIFDLTKNGCSFRVKVDSQGEFPTYVSSRFLSPSNISGLDADTIKDIYESTTELDEVLPVKPYDELVAILNDHYYCNAGQAQPAKDPDLDEEVPMDTKPATYNTDDVDDEEETPLDDDKIKDLLAGLDDD